LLFTPVSMTRPLRVGAATVVCAAGDSLEAH